MDYSVVAEKMFYAIDFRRHDKQLWVRWIDLYQRTSVAAARKRQAQILSATKGKLPPPPGLLKRGLMSERQQPRSISSTIRRPYQGGAPGLGKRA